jgi:hypothetical protein
MRWYGLTPEEVREIIASGERLNRGGRWESQYQGLKAIWLTVGDYILVVTVIKLSRE